MLGQLSSYRRNDFDWLRVGALGLLILTHVLYIYRVMPWRVQSEHAGLWGTVVVEALAPWRISLVFFIAGAATRFMLQRHSFGAFLQNRILRLGVPFVMAVIVLVPPMLYTTDPHAAGHNYFAYVVDHGAHARHLFGVSVPDLGHVWFLPYLLAYSFVAALAWFAAPRTFNAACNALARQPVVLIVLALAAAFIVADAGLQPIFGRSDLFFDDPAGHVRCIPPFLLGVMLARADQFWSELSRARRWLVPAAIVAGVIYLAMVSAGLLGSGGAKARIAASAGGVFGAIGLLTILGLGAAHLQHESRAMRYLSDAIMPIYLLHQPMIVVSEAWLHVARLPLWLEFPLVLASASLVPLAVYHFAIRPTPAMRILFGLKAESPLSASNRRGPGEAAAG